MSRKQKKNESNELQSGAFSVETDEEKNTDANAGKEMKLEETKKPEGKSSKAAKKIFGCLELFCGSYVWIFVGQCIGVIGMKIIGGILEGTGSEIQKSDLWVTSELYLAFLGTWLVMLLVMWFGKKNRPMLQLLGSRMKGNNVKGILIGTAIGGGANAICAAVALLHGDIKIYYDAFQVLPLLFLLAAVLIQSAAEELVCRCYLYRKLMDLYQGNVWLCIGLNSLFFSLLHLGNDNVTVFSLLNIFLSGVLFSLMVHYMESLWAAFAGHMAWNYTQNIIFGLPNSGNVVPYSIFKLDAASARDSFAYNVGFGIEGTVTADIVLLLCCVAMYLWGRKKTEEKK